MRAIHQHQCPGGVRAGGNLGHRVDGAQHVRHVRQAHQLGFLRQNAVERGQVRVGVALAWLDGERDRGRIGAGCGLDLAAAQVEVDAQRLVLAHRGIELSPGSIAFSLC